MNNIIQHNRIRLHCFLLLQAIKPNIITPSINIIRILLLSLNSNIVCACCFSSEKTANTNTLLSLQIITDQRAYFVGLIPLVYLKNPLHGLIPNLSNNYAHCIDLNINTNIYLYLYSISNYRFRKHNNCHRKDLPYHEILN